MKVLFLLFLLSVPCYVQGQTDPDALEKRLKSEAGFDKLATLNQLSAYYQESQDRRFKKYSKQGYQLIEKLSASEVDYSADQRLLIARALNFYAISQYNRKQYQEAKGLFERAKFIARSVDNTVESARASSYLIKIDSSASETGNFFKRTLNDLQLDHLVSNTNTNLGIAYELKMAKISENRNDTSKVIQHYRKAVQLLREKGELLKADEIETKIAAYRRTKALEVQLAQLPVHTSPQDADTRLDLTDTTVQTSQRTAESLLIQVAQLEARDDYQAALVYYKEYTALQRKWEKDSLESASQRALVLLEMDQLKKENEIADLNITAIQREKEAEVRTKRVLFVGLASIAITTIVILILYMTKRKKHHQLTRAYEDLDQAREDLQEAKVHISKLLEQQVSPEIASALIEDAPEKRKQFVAIMFLDIRDFTPIAERMEADELIEYQNNIFGFMIEIIRKYHGNINQFMGDGFMATFGAPISHGEDIRNAFRAGKEILTQLDEINAIGDIPHTQVGIGIHAGPVVTGNVGTESRKQFSVTGNTVILAARIEQLNKQYLSRMIISQEVHAYLEAADTNEMNYSSHETHIKGRTEPIRILVFDEKAPVTLSPN